MICVVIGAKRICRTGQNLTLNARVPDFVGLFRIDIMVVINQLEWWSRVLHLIVGIDVVTKIIKEEKLRFIGRPTFLLTNVVVST